MPDVSSKFQTDPSITFRVILLTHRQTDKQTKSDKNITSEVTIFSKLLTLLCVQVHSASYPDKRM